MTPEERERHDRVDRQLEFLAAHQAQFASDLAELQRIVFLHSDQIARLEAQIAKQGEQITMQGEQIAKQGEQIGTQGGQVQSLADSVLRLARILDERDRQTDAKINILIGVVERYFTNGKK